MIFIETPIFTADVQLLLSDEEYTRLQDYLVGHPDAGEVIARKGIKDDLTPKEKSVLRKINAEW